MDKKNYYITTTLPYVNADPHIGFAFELIQADVLARYQKLLGNEVIFNYGTDEHGAKIYDRALEKKIEPQKYCDQLAIVYRSLKKHLNLSTTNFIRTTDANHIKAAQEFWKLCDKNGDIYKKNYKTKYCVGCELEKTDSELADGKCPIHPNREIEIREEENYFFRFSKYQKALLDHYTQHPDFVIPSNRLKEISTFVRDGLQDFSISRLISKMPWGIPVPGDPEHVMYVWFDALINYISTLGWPVDEKNFKTFWPGTQVAGKDNLRQQSAMWQAMLASSGLSFSKQIFIHGFLTLNGQKISKSLGNSIDPIELVKKYGVDAVRYYLLAKIHPFEDSDFTYEKFEDAYNSDLANGLGNLVSRVAKLCEKSDNNFKSSTAHLYERTENQIKDFRFDLALFAIWARISILDQKINLEQPWNKQGEDLKLALNPLVSEIQKIAYDLKPFLPETAEKIEKQFKGPKIISGDALFPRLKKI